jgi:hypothetical protein
MLKRAPAARARRSATMRLTLIAPTFPQLTTPGRAFASASRSPSVFHGESLATAMPVDRSARPIR